MNLPPSPLILERRVDFNQTDAAGLMHFSTYFTFMEAAEAELFRQLGLPLIWTADGLTHGFPRVDCSARFRRPLTFDALVRTELRVEDLLANRIHYGFTFFDPAGQRCATGSMSTACALRDTAGVLTAAELPERHRAALLAWKNQGC